jgi:hypothetical protein
MENPLILGHYGQEDLVDYALYRKGREMESVKKLLTDERVEEGRLTTCELEDYREPLAFSRETVVTVELSTGGDADGFKLTFDESKELVGGLYYWADWGVYEEVNLTNGELDLVDRLYSVSDWLASL